MTNNNSTNSDLESQNAALKAQVAILAQQHPMMGAEAYAEDEIDLGELWQAVWAGKWLIMAITGVFSIAAVLYALWLPNQYKSTVLLAPASSSSSSSLSKLAGQFGGLASLAGINLGGGGAEDKSVVAMEIPKTLGFLEAFIQQNNIQAQVYAAKGWSRGNNQLVYDEDLYDVKQTKNGCVHSIQLKDRR
ncbi:MAG: Wzz/FepE/Etk N-terminal domain-containing protein [Enterobacterales bacterium]|nr:Wzz/FepE/Etk N-terminal domain-containing protein [Enterobacterales bacterium]